MIIQTKALLRQYNFLVLIFYIAYIIKKHDQNKKGGVNSPQDVEKITTIVSVFDNLINKYQCSSLTRA